MSLYWYFLNPNQLTSVTGPSKTFLQFWSGLSSVHHIPKTSISYQTCGRGGAFTWHHLGMGQKLYASHGVSFSWLLWGCSQTTGFGNTLPLLEIWWPLWLSSLRIGCPKTPHGSRLLYHWKQPSCCQMDWCRFMLSAWNLINVFVKHCKTICNMLYDKTWPSLHCSQDYQELWCFDIQSGTPQLVDIVALLSNQLSYVRTVGVYKKYLACSTSTSCTSVPNPLPSITLWKVLYLKKTLLLFPATSDTSSEWCSPHAALDSLSRATLRSTPGSAAGAGSADGSAKQSASERPSLPYLSGSTKKKI